MASQKKIAVRVLDLCDDAQSKCLWKHVWMIYGDSTEKDLFMKKIGVVNEFASSDPIAISSTNNRFDKAQMHKCIRQTFIGLIQEKNLQIKQLANISIKVEELKTISSKFSKYEVGIYINKEVENSLWIVGPTMIIGAVVEFIEDNIHICSVNISTIVKSDELKSSREKKEAHSYVELSEEDQAILWIYDLLELECLKRANTAIVQHHFGLQILVPDSSTKLTVENEIRSVITSGCLSVCCKHHTVSHSLCQFIKRNTVHAFLDSKLNIQFQGLDLQGKTCVWFQHNQNTLKFYAANGSKLEHAIGVFKDALKEDIISVPSRYFSRDDAKQKLAKLENNENGKLSIKLSNDCATVNVSRTGDYWFNSTHIEHMYTSKSLLIPKQKLKTIKKLLNNHKSSIENQYSVNIYEQDEPFCKWTVKGDDSMVEAAYQELLNLLQMPGQDKTYIIEDKIADMQLRVTNIADSHRCCVSLLPDKVISTKLQTKPVDLREHIRCRSITVDDGFTVKLYKCSLQKNYWLGQNTLILNVGHSAGDDTSTIKCNVNLIQPGHATICLPIWKITKEKDYLQKLMTEMKDYVKSAKLQGLPPMSIDLSEVEKVRWPVVHFLGTILLSFNFSRPTYFHVFAPSDDIFEPSFDIINQWCQLEKGFLKQKLQINVVKGELAVMKCDVLVNATNREFDLSRGMVSKALLKAAGVDLQHDCDMTIKGRKIQSTEVVVTGGYNLSAKKVFHGVLPRFKKENNIQQYESFIKNCLNTAVDLNMKSIAFPALGTGKLNYPSNTAASTMFLAVEAFASANNVGSLTEVNFVIFPADTSVLQVFEAEEHNRKKTASAGKMFDDSVVACPDFATCTVQVIGPTDKLIQDTFKQIEEAFNRNGKTDQGIRSDRVAQLKASVKHGSKYPKGDIQYLQHLMNAMEDLRPDSLDRRQNMTYSSHNFPTAGTVWISEKNDKNFSVDSSEVTNSLQTNRRLDNKNYK